MSAGLGYSIPLCTITGIDGMYLYMQGTQSANPHNDYSQHFVDSGQRPQNFIRDVGKCLHCSATHVLDMYFAYDKY